jgi:hypothetical protein
MKPIENFIAMVGGTDFGEHIPNAVMSISQGQERKLERLVVHPVDKSSVVLEIGTRGKLMESQCLIVVPDTGLAQGCSQSHFTPVETHFADCLADDCFWELMTMHQSVLGTVGNCYSSEYFNIVG